MSLHPSICLLVHLGGFFFFFFFLTQLKVSCSHHFSPKHFSLYVMGSLLKCLSLPNTIPSAIYYLKIKNFKLISYMSIFSPLECYLKFQKNFRPGFNYLTF